MDLMIWSIWETKLNNKPNLSPLAHSCTIAHSLVVAAGRVDVHGPLAWPLRPVRDLYIVELQDLIEDMHLSDRHLER